MKTRRRTTAAGVTVVDLVGLMNAKAAALKPVVEAVVASKLLTFEQAAATFNIPIDVLKAAARAGRLRVVRFSAKTVRLRPASLAAFISRQSTPDFNGTVDGRGRC